MKPLSIRSVILVSITNVILAFIPLFFLLAPRKTFAQSGEFISHENGLIYPPKTIGQLKYIVDSLHLKFKVCDANPTYFAKAQTVAHFVSLEGVRCKAVQKDMDAGMSLSDLLLKYKELKVVRNLSLVRYRETNTEGKEFIGFKSLGFGEDAEQYLAFHNNFEKYQGSLAGKWIVNYEAGSQGYPAELEAFFITREFDAPRIPLPYARWIQYADCLVDTTAQIFSEKAIKHGGLHFFDERQAPKIHAFEKYLHERATKDSSFMLSNTDSTLRNFAEAAYTEALKEGAGSATLERYFEKHGAADRVLELKRNRIVVGFCSQDMSPRTHALEIAKLSAETVKWEIFLRAHLDIMNDKFERMTDGNYAWGDRQTYLRELEVLDIQVADLLLGISLRISNPAANHYDGYIGRIGRALTEYKDLDGIEQMMEQVITDKNVDLYNRTLIYYLLLNYNHFLKDEPRKTANVARIERMKGNLEQGIATASVK